MEDVMFTENDRIVDIVKDAISLRIITHRWRTHAYLVTITYGTGSRIFNAASVPVFNSNRNDFICCLSGILGVETEEEKKLLMPGDDEIEIIAGTTHRLYAVPIPDECQSKDEETQVTAVMYLISGTLLDRPVETNILFYENWFQLWNHIVEKGETERDNDYQTMSILDAVGIYKPLPGKYSGLIPGDRMLAKLRGIVIGRWMGGFHGYLPYYQKWSTNWHLACSQMNATWFQARKETRPCIPYGSRCGIRRKKHGPKWWEVWPLVSNPYRPV